MRIRYNSVKSSSYKPRLLAVHGDVASAATLGAEDLVGDDGLRFRDLLELGEAVVLAQRAVEQRQLAQLLSPQVVLLLGNLDSLLNNVFDLERGLRDIVWIGCSDVGVQRLVLAWHRLTVFPTNLALLYRSFSTNNNFCTSLKTIKITHVTPMLKECCSNMNTMNSLLFPGFSECCLSVRSTNRQS